MSPFADKEERVRSPRSADMLKNAVVTIALCSLFAVGTGWLLRHWPPPGDATPRAAAMLAPKAATGARNELSYRADRSGHFFIDAVVNGAPVRFLVDTGASLVALTPEDARAAGLSPGTLGYRERLSTAHGEARAARITLREVRLGQLSVDEVPAVVMAEPMGISLLGMSFLSRLDGYRIHDGMLTIEW